MFFFCFLWLLLALVPRATSSLDRDEARRTTLIVRFATRCPLGAHAGVISTWVATAQRYPNATAAHEDSVVEDQAHTRHRLHHDHNNHFPRFEILPRAPRVVAPSAMSDFALVSVPESHVPLWLDMGDRARARGASAGVSGVFLDSPIAALRQRAEPQGRPTSFSTSTTDPPGGEQSQHATLLPPGRRKLLRKVLRYGDKATPVAQRYGAPRLWARGVDGSGVVVAVFDSGLDCAHPDFKNLESCTDWTAEGTAADTIGHGTFVAGVIAGTGRACPGFAPGARLRAYRVFDSQQSSHTSWFLDAFNDVLLAGDVDVLNLSIGGPDYLDTPFVDKVRELAASGVLVVSAIGNDGPLFGTLNNPADLPEVLGVGGLTDTGLAVAPFSSRGVTTSAFGRPGGYGAVKPDIVTIAQHVRGTSRSTVGGGCKAYSGSSVASPVAAGAVALLISGARRAGVRNLGPAVIKRAVLETAVPVDPLDAGLAGPGMFEQGAGRLDLDAALAAVLASRPGLTAFPAGLDLTSCPYHWPYCEQPLYHTGPAAVVNVTLISSLGPLATLVGEPVWTANPKSADSAKQARVGSDVDIDIDVELAASPVLWPYNGHISISVTVPASAAAARGVASGSITVTYRAAGRVGQHGNARPMATVTIPLSVRLIPTPPRRSRICFDGLRQLGYPSGGYIPRDSIAKFECLA
jgi:hypothetical protein